MIFFFSNKAMKHQPYTRLIIIIASLIGGSLYAQQLTYSDFINQVTLSNHDYLAAQHQCSEIEALSHAARKIANPAISAGYDNNSDRTMLMGQSASLEISQTISFGRAARLRNAGHVAQAAQASLQHYRSTLLADATQAYLQALLQRDLVAISTETIHNLTTLYQADSLRYASGDLSQIDLMQSRIELGVALQEHTNLEASYRQALLQLDQLMGNPSRGTTQLQGQLTLPQQHFHPDSLMHWALQGRHDIAEAKHLSQAAQSELTELRRERLPEIELSLGANYNTRVRNEEAPAPQFVGYSFALSMPLPVANINRGDIIAGQHRVQQAQEQQLSICDQAVIQVLSALNSYQAAHDRALLFNNQFLQQALQVLEGRLYAYRRGESTLLEVVEAQRTYNDIRTAHAESLFQCQSALIDLEYSAGIWDISF